MEELQAATEVEITELPSGGPTVPKSNEENVENAIKFITFEQKALYNMIRLDIRNYLNLLTAHGTTGNMQKQIKESMERAIVMAMDYGTEVLNPVLQDHGRLGKLEQAFAAHLAKSKENGMLIIANNMGKAEKEAAAEATAAEEVPVTEELNN